MSSEVTSTTNVDDASFQKWKGEVGAKSFRQSEMIATHAGKSVKIEARLDADATMISQSSDEHNGHMMRFVDIESRLAALEEHSHEVPDQPIPIERENKTEPWIIIEPGEYKNVTVAGVKDRHAIKVRANDVTLTDVESFDNHGTALYAKSGDNVKNLTLNRFTAREVGMGPVIYGENTQITSLEVDRLIQRFFEPDGDGMDADYLRLFGTGAVQWYYAHGTKLEEIGRSHVDGFQTFGVGFDGIIRDFWIDGVHQGTITEGDTTVLNLKNGVITRQLEDNGTGMLAKGNTTLFADNVITNDMFKAMFARQTSGGEAKDCIFSGGRGAWIDPKAEDATLDITHTLTDNHSPTKPRIPGEGEIWNEDPLMTLTPPKNAMPWKWDELVTFEEGSPALSGASDGGRLGPR